MPADLRFKRGALSGLPALAAGEPGMSTDQIRLYLGSAGGNRLVGLLHRVDATAAPGTGDDSADGYSPGSLWVDVTNDLAYVCLDASAGAAVWQVIGSAGGTIAVADGGTGRTSHTAYAVLCGGTTSTGAQQSIASVGTAGQVLTSNGAGALPSFQTPASTVPRGHIDGLTLSYNATYTMNVAAGQCADSTGAYLLSLAAFTKVLQGSGAWTAGTGNNGLDTGARAANTWYHVWVIADSTGSTVDVLYSASATSPTMPSGYTLKRRIGAVYADSGATFSGFQFVQFGDHFIWAPRVDDVSALNPGTAAVTRTLTVPTGVKVRALVAAGFDATATADNAAAVLLSSLDTTDTAPSVSAYTQIAFSSSALIANAGGRAEIWTNTSAQIRSRVQVSTANTRLRIQTYGWVDPRGRDG